ncbi:hypothetical protein BC835DRAFT_1287910, partial [Cytidiella melzeri]
NPTKKVVSPGGTILYINDVGHAIAKDYPNPLTRFAMSDYPEDQGCCMSEARHGFKMLCNAPQGIATPAIRAQRKIYFAEELLEQSDGTYFIPERFFVDNSLSQWLATAGQSQDSLTDLGHSVSLNEVS